MLFRDVLENIIDLLSNFFLITYFIRLYTKDF